MLIKLLGAILVIGGGAGGGILLGRQLRMRQERLLEGKRAVELLQAQIRNAGLPLPEALLRSGEYTENMYGKAFLEMARRLYEYSGEPVSVIWSEVIREYLSSACMTEQDVRRLTALGEQLGLADRRLQENVLQDYICYADGELSLLNAEVGEKVKLYRNLGILFGVFVAILLL